MLRLSIFARFIAGLRYFRYRVVVIIFIPRLSGIIFDEVNAAKGGMPRKD